MLLLVWFCLWLANLLGHAFDCPVHFSSPLPILSPHTHPTSPHPSRLLRRPLANEKPPSLPSLLSPLLFPPPFFPSYPHASVWFGDLKSGVRERSCTRLLLLSHTRRPASVPPFLWNLGQSPPLRLPPFFFFSFRSPISRRSSFLPLYPPQPLAPRRAQRPDVRLVIERARGGGRGSASKRPSMT